MHPNPASAGQSARETSIKEPVDQSQSPVPGGAEAATKRSASFAAEYARLERAERWRAARGPILAAVAVFAIVGWLMTLEVGRAQRDTDEMTKLIEHAQNYSRPASAPESAAMANGKHGEAR